MLFASNAVPPWSLDLMLIIHTIITEKARLYLGSTVIISTTAIPTR
jgi:hypothetical protein